jgi:RNA polymerase sigma factor (sigma-70 family)
MHTRQSIIEIFSSFVQLEEDRFSGWASDARLRRSMQSCVNRTLQADNREKISETFWALYWYKVWQSQATSLAKGHLSAYLQEPCYWEAKKTAASFSSNQYSLSDCFQVAISQIDRVLKGYNANQGFVLKNYATVIFSSVIRETLRQRHEVDICTPWGLLRKISQKRLIESLQAAGLSSQTIDAYVLAWNCFKTLYVPHQATVSRQLTKPDNQTWQAIASFYNSQTPQRQNAATLEKWLLNSATAARNYLYPSLTSINNSVAGQDVEWVDNIPANEQDSLLSEIIAQEEEENRIYQQAEINQVLVAALDELEPQGQKILQFYYGERLTQQQIAAKLEMKQYTVSRRLTKSRESLLQKLAQWSQEKLHISVNSDLLQNTTTVLEEWLQNHYLPPQFPSSLE